MNEEEFFCVKDSDRRISCFNRRGVFLSSNLSKGKFYRIVSSEKNSFLAEHVERSPNFTDYKFRLKQLLYEDYRSLYIKLENIMGEIGGDFLLDIDERFLLFELILLFFYPNLIIETFERNVKVPEDLGPYTELLSLINMELRSILGQSINIQWKYNFLNNANTIFYFLDRPIDFPLIHITGRFLREDEKDFFWSTHIRDRAKRFMNITHDYLIIHLGL